MLIEAAEAVGHAQMRTGPGGRLLAQAWLETCYSAWRKHGQMVSCHSPCKTAVMSKRKGDGKKGTRVPLDCIPVRTLQSPSAPAKSEENFVGAETTFPMYFFCDESVYLLEKKAAPD